MFPWEQYPPGDPLADPANWRWDDPNQQYVPATSLPDAVDAAASLPTDGSGTLYIPAGSPDYLMPVEQAMTDFVTGGPMPSNAPISPATDYTQQPAYGSVAPSPTAATDYTSQPAYGSYSPPAYDPLSSGNPGAPPSGPSGGYATEPMGGNDQLDPEYVKRFKEYELAQQGGGAVAPAQGGVPQPTPGIAADGSAGGTTNGSASYDNTGYGGGGDSGSGGYQQPSGSGSPASSYPYPEMGNFGRPGGMFNPTGEPRGGGQPGDPNFDPFGWSGVSNPAAGRLGEMPAQEPPPRPRVTQNITTNQEFNDPQKSVLESIKMGMKLNEQLLAQQPTAQPPQFNATNYVMHRLGLVEPDAYPQQPPVNPETEGQWRPPQFQTYRR